MAYDFGTFDRRVAEIIEWLQKEFTSIRTGRATPALLDGVHVESYGAKMPLNQVGTVGAEDARTLRVSVWDAGQVKEVEKAIIDADLGLSVVTDEKGLRVIFPELTGERREQLLKMAKGKLEEARIQLRGARDESIRKVEADIVSDDEKFRAKEDMQKRMEKSNDILLQAFTAKEVEIKN